METFIFTMHYKLPPEVRVMDLSEQLGAAGITDVLVGTGRAGYFGLQFDREALTMEGAIEDAQEEIQRIIPYATLLSVDEEPCVPT
jgi:hypothetical protein